MNDTASEIADVVDALSPILDRAIRETGAQLPPERVLAERLGIPRRRLRFALEHLEDKGVIFRRRGQGTYVSPPPLPERGRHKSLAEHLDVDDLMDVRRQIEPRIAELAASNSDANGLEKLRESLEQTQSATSPIEYEVADEIFHYRIAELAGNELYLQIYDLIRQMRKESAWQTRRNETHNLALIEALGVQHQEIFDAIASGDQSRAGQSLRTHIDFVADAILPDRAP